jgi:hypothetical protein
MSWATCYSGSNNIHFESPPLMSDGRNYASWQPEAVINERIRKAEKIQSNWDYRQFMIHHGEKIVENNTLEACQMMGYTFTPEPPNSEKPFQPPMLYASLHDNRPSPFGYQQSDLKNEYLTREQLNARLISPTIRFP